METHTHRERNRQEERKGKKYEDLFDPSAVFATSPRINKQIGFTKVLFQIERKKSCAVAL
jgi:hypothetical protein